MLGYFVLLCLLLPGVSLSLVYFELRKIRLSLYGEKFESFEEFEVSDKLPKYADTLTDSFDVESEHDKRQKEFQERIERIKDELASKQRTSHTGTTADILHPGVTNLPHDSIPDSIPLGVEYAE